MADSAVRCHACARIPILFFVARTAELNSRGQLACQTRGTTSTQLAALPLTDLGWTQQSNFVSVAVSDAGVCALESTGSALCLSAPRLSHSVYSTTLCAVGLRRSINRTTPSTTSLEATASCVA